MNRYASHIVDLMAVKPLERRNEAVLALESTPNGLLATDLFKGLFDGVSFENVKNAAAEWEEMVREATPGSNSAQIAVSWHQSEFGQRGYSMRLTDSERSPSL